MIFDGLVKKIKYRDAERQQANVGPTYEFCPRCDANLTLQKGYSNSLPYWNCRGCGEMLINPSVPSDTVWICDACEAMLNIQDGFSEEAGFWRCTECGFVNKIDKSEIYLSEEEFQAAFKSPYRGLSDEDMLALYAYDEEGPIGGRDDIILVRNMSDDVLYVKKILNTFDRSVYEYLKDNPIEHMPEIHEIFESDNSLVVIEEYIEGRTLLELLGDGPLPTDRAIDIELQICRIVSDLHSPEHPIIHRDIKPSNVILDPAGTVWLCDMNISKWYREGETEDTRLLGTQYYAAPEQLGYGFSASSEKADIYAMGILLNVMVTGRFPKEEKAPEPVWSVVEKCISLEPEERMTDGELMDALEETEAELKEDI